MEYPECEYLAHHGIKGQKWGVRRTPEQLGRARAANTLKEKVKTASNKVKKSMNPAKDLSDAELDKRLTRLRKEKEYRELLYPGRTFVKQVLTSSSKTAVNSFAKNPKSYTDGAKAVAKTIKNLKKLKA